MDKIYLQTESAKYGPYCVGPSDRVKRRKRRSTDNNLVLSSYSPQFDVSYDDAIDDARSDVVSAMAQQLIEENTELELSQDEMEEVDGVFASDAMDVIYVTAPGGYKFRFKFNFEWELIEMPGAMTEVDGIYYPTQAATHDVWGIPFQYDAVCQVSQFQPQAQAIFNDEVDIIAKGKDMNDLDGNNLNFKIRSVLIFKFIYFFVSPIILLFKLTIVNSRLTLT